MPGPGKWTDSKGTTHTKGSNAVFFYDKTAQNAAPDLYYAFTNLVGTTL